MLGLEPAPIVSSTYISIDRVPYQDCKIKSDEWALLKEAKAGKIDRKKIKVRPSRSFWSIQSTFKVVDTIQSLGLEKPGGYSIIWTRYYNCNG